MRWYRGPSVSHTLTLIDAVDTLVKIFTIWYGILAIFIAVIICKTCINKTVKREKNHSIKLSLEKWRFKFQKLNLVKDVDTWGVYICNGIIKEILFKSSRIFIFMVIRNCQKVNRTLMWRYSSLVLMWQWKTVDEKLHNPPVSWCDP